MVDGGKGWERFGGEMRMVGITRMGNVFGCDGIENGKWAMRYGVAYWLQ